MRWDAPLACAQASPRWMIENGVAPGLGHFVGLFRDATRRYLESLMTQCKPRVVGVCMLYFLDEKPGGSWADFTLQRLGYDKDPSKLQLIMREVFKRATCRVDIGGTTVVPIALYEALDGKNTADYVQRVEPSPQGGAKMARALMDAVVGTTASPAGSPWEEMGEVTPSPPPSPLTPLSSTSASPLMCAPSSCAVSRG